VSQVWFSHPVTKRNYMSPVAELVYLAGLIVTLIYPPYDFTITE
jgi:hypothetical protein